MSKINLFPWAMQGLTIKFVSTDEELVQIKCMMTQHLITSSEANKEGMVTSDFSLKLLQAMHVASPSVIAQDRDGAVIAYALVATKDVCVRYSGEHSVLRMLMDAGVDITSSTHAKLCTGTDPDTNPSYFCIAQLCVAKAYRGIGLAPLLYGHLEAYAAAELRNCDFVVTPVVKQHTRSVAAHQKWGFRSFPLLSLSMPPPVPQLPATVNRSTDADTDTGTGTGTDTGIPCCCYRGDGIEYQLFMWSIPQQESESERRVGGKERRGQSN